MPSVARPRMASAARLSTTMRRMAGLAAKPFSAPFLSKTGALDICRSVRRSARAVRLGLWSEACAVRNRRHLGCPTLCCKQFRVFSRREIGQGGGKKPAQDRWCARTGACAVSFSEHFGESLRDTFAQRLCPLGVALLAKRLMFVKIPGRATPSRLATPLWVP